MFIDIDFNFQKFRLNISQKGYISDQDHPNLRNKQNEIKYYIWLICKTLFVKLKIM